MMDLENGARDWIAKAVRSAKGIEHLLSVSSPLSSLVSGRLVSNLSFLAEMQYDSACRMNPLHDVWGNLRERPRRDE